MKNYPNASILTLITQTEGSKEKLLFIYLKQIPDFYPYDKIHWYDGAGKDGEATNVWGKLSIKQWVACGKDKDIDQLFDTILSTHKLVITAKEIQLIIPPYKYILHNDDPIRSRGETVYDSLKTANNTLIPQVFYQKENLKFLSGYKTGGLEIKPLYPLGFFEDNFIYDNLKNDTWGIKEHRKAYLTFHGVRKTSEKKGGSKEMVGFYQQDFKLTSDYSAVVKNESHKEIGKALIDKKTGFFKINLSEPTQKGKVEILINNKEEKAIEYVLIQDIQISAHIANTTFSDTYGRSFMITSDEKSRPESIPDFTWQQSVYADVKEGNQKLSDLFKSIFDYLGPRVLVVDPYFIGDINEDKTTKALSLSHCQTAFINGLIHSAIQKGITKLSVLGYWGRARNHIQNDWLNNYEKIFKHLISVNKLQSYFPPSTFTFLNAKEDFHNRYWFSLTEKEGTEVLDKCVIITNSIGNISEVDVMPVTDEQQLRQIIRKYTGIYKNSEIKLSI